MKEQKKRLVFQNDLIIEQRTNFATQLVENCNSVLESFTTDWNLFDVPIDEPTAWELIGDPVGFFDNLLLQNSPIKPFGNAKQNPVKLAELTGIDREGWKSTVTLLIPGSQSVYNREGRHEIFKLLPQHRYLVAYHNGQFIVDADGLEQELDRQRIYADTPAKLELLDYWENLANVLNQHLQRGYVSTLEIYPLSRSLGLDGNSSKEFRVNYKHLAPIIKDL